MTASVFYTSDDTEYDHLDFIDGITEAYIYLSVLIV